MTIASDGPVITALRSRGAGRVDVELDGRSWRVVPVEAVLRTGLARGARLDRVTARALGRELRRLKAQEQALRALRARDHTAISLERRLGDRGAAPAVRRETVAAAQRAGLVDDRRFALGRAVLLAGRAAGDAMISSDLERQGVQEEDILAALAALEPESERAGRIVAARGSTVRTARYLASRGFSEDALETLVAELSADAIE